MVEIRDINPLTPVWPGRPPEDARHRKERQPAGRREDKDSSDRDRDSDDGGIDEYA